MARPKVIAIQGNGILDYFWMEKKNIIDCPRIRSTKSKQKNMNRTIFSLERKTKSSKLGAYYELTEEIEWKSKRVQTYW